MRTLIETLHEKSVTKQKSGNNQKKLCLFNDGRSCDGCNSMRFVSSAKRWCYDEKFDLSRVEEQMRYKKDGVTHIVATGVIENVNPSYDSKESYEGNLKPVVYDSNFTYLNIIEKACSIHSISFDKFMKSVQKISKNYGEEIKILKIIKTKRKIQISNAMQLRLF